MPPVQRFNLDVGETEYFEQKKNVLIYTVPVKYNNITINVVK
jgi:hypothetical protein